jgi:hypothetical protein
VGRRLRPYVAESFRAATLPASVPLARKSTPLLALAAAEDQVDECEHYTQTISGGTVGCTDSHLFAWAFFAQRGLSAYGVADSLLVKALEKVSDSVASDAPNHRASNLCPVRFAPSLAHAPKGGDAGRHGRR